MKLEWFGRYREISAALVQFSNVMIKTATTEWDIGDGVFLTGPEWQLLEVIVEHDDENLIMTEYAKLLGLSRSSVSKIAKTLMADDLIEKYKFKDNNKNIILKPSKRGIALYFDYVESLVGPLWNNLFAGLSALDDRSLSIAAAAIRSLNSAELSKSSAEEGNSLIKV